MEAKFMTITPELAKEWRDQFVSNPRWRTNGKMVDRRKVQKIKVDIENGEWNTAGDPIRWSADGRFLDGHHRITAIAEGDTAVDALVVFGVPEEAEIHIDDNDRRNLSARIGSDNSVVAMASIGLSCLKGTFGDIHSDAEKAEWVLAHTSAYEAKLIGTTGSSVSLMKKAGCLTAVLFAMEYGVSETKLRAFCEIVNSGYANGGAGVSAAITLRNMLLKQPFRSYKDRLELCFHTQAAIYDYVNDIPRRNAYVNRSGYYFDAMKRMKDPRYILGSNK